MLSFTVSRCHCLLEKECRVSYILIRYGYEICFRAKRGKNFLTTLRLMFRLYGNVNHEPLGKTALKKHLCVLLTQLIRYTNGRKRGKWTIRRKKYPYIPAKQYRTKGRNDTNYPLGHLRSRPIENANELGEKMKDWLSFYWKICRCKFCIKIWH